MPKVHTRAKRKRRMHTHLDGKKALKERRKKRLQAQLAKQ